MGERSEEGGMRDPLQKVLDFAAAREREAEAFYKEWARKADHESVRVLFGELGAAEHDHWQLLAHVTPTDVMARSTGRVADLGISGWLVEVRVRPGLSLQEALVVAMKREESSAQLYDRLAQYGGESATLFRALANEERSHKKAIETIRDESMLKEN
jgi:rubrerythrin